jgi:phosphate transport system permease protein
VAASLKRRYAAERRFRGYGLTAIIFAIFCLAALLFTIVRTALPATPYV